MSDTPPAAAPMTTRNAIGLAAIVGATFMGQVDGFVVTIAAPTLQATLPASFADIQMIGAGYVIAAGSGLVLGGRLGDRFGRRRVFMIGVALFGLTSLVCGVAPTAAVVIAARIAQGFAAAAMIPQELALIREMFADDRQRARAISIYGVAIGLGVIVGIAGGGALVYANVFGLGWRTVFLINIPIAAAILAATALCVRVGSPRMSTSLDLPSAVLTFTAFAGVLTPVVLAGDGVAPAWVWALMVIGPVAGWALTYRQRRASAPLFGSAAFSAAGVRRRIAVFATFFAGNSGLFLVFTYYTQGPLGADPVLAGLMFAPLGAGFMVGSWTGGAGRRLGDWSPTVGCLGVAVLLSSQIGVVALPRSAQVLLLGVGMALLGAAMGLIVPPLTEQILRRTDVASVGAVSGVVATVTQFGLATGYTVIGVIYRAVQGDRPDDATGTLPYVVAVLTLAALALLSATLARPTANPREPAGTKSDAVTTTTTTQEERS